MLFFDNCYLKVTIAYEFKSLITLMSLLLQRKQTIAVFTEVPTQLVHNHKERKGSKLNTGLDKTVLIDFKHQRKINKK